MRETERVILNVFLSFFPPQSHAPVDLYLMTKNPQEAPNTPDVLEIEFKNGALLQPTNYRTQPTQSKYCNKKWLWINENSEIYFKDGYKVLKMS